MKKWLNNNFIKPSKLRKQRAKDSIKAFGKRDERYEELLKEVYIGSSEYIHPTYSISKMNMNHKTLDFDYQWEKIKETNFCIYISVAQVVFTVINSFKKSRDFYEIDDNEYTRLNELIKIVDELDI